MRPDGQSNIRVYSGGDSFAEGTDGEKDEATRTLNESVLEEGQDGSNTAIALGTFDHDNIPAAHAKNSDGVSVAIEYSFEVNPGTGYHHSVFEIDSGNQLFFTGENSGVFGETAPYKLSVETTVIVTIELPDDFAGRIDADASSDTEDSDTREFSFSGGEISRTNDNPNVIAVATGKIYVADAEAGTSKIIHFGTKGLSLPNTPDIYEYHIIVIPNSDDLSGRVSAVADLPTDGTEFYVIGTVGSAIPTITIDGIQFTDKLGGGVPKIKFTFKASGDAEVNVVDDTISIKITSGMLVSDLLAALRNNDAVKALVDVTTVAEYDGKIAILATDFGEIKLSGGANAVSGGAAATKAQIDIGGLIIAASDAQLGASGNRITFYSIESGDDDRLVDIGGGNRVIQVTYGSQATLGDLITALNADTRTNDLVDFNTSGANYNPDTLLSDVFFKLYNIAEDDATPTLSSGGTRELYTQTATIGNIEVSVLSANDDTDVVIRTLHTDTTQTNGNKAVASIVPSTGKATITVLFLEDADSGDIVAALNELDAVSASIASGTADDDAGDNFLTSYAMTGADASTAGSVTLGSLIITAAANNVNYNITSYARGAPGVNITFDGTNMNLFYSRALTLENLETAINDGGGFTADGNPISQLIATQGASYNGATLLIDIFGVSADDFTDPVIYLVKGDNYDPTPNPTGTAHNTGNPYNWQTEETLNPEDFTIYLGPNQDPDIL